MELQKPSWVEYFMSLALGASIRSKDPKTQVGCVIVHSETRKILSIGYNGFPPGISNSDQNWEKEAKKDLVVHAEANAVLLKGGANLEGSIAFVTLFPCEECAKMLIQAGVRKVYYLSFRDNYRKSEEIFKAAKVEFVPVNRGDDGTLAMFRNGFINMFKAAIQNVTNTEIDDSSRQLCERLKKKTKRLREEDIKSPWPRDIQPGKCSDKATQTDPIQASTVASNASAMVTGQGIADQVGPLPPATQAIREDTSTLDREVLFKQWKDYFLFLALLASTRSSRGAVNEGALLLDSKTSKICSLSYKGYPRGVDETPDDKMMVSAIGNVLALRFCEGNKFYAFCTNFPQKGEVKNLAQAEVERLYFISPTNMTEKALSTLQAASVEVVPMDLLNAEMIEQEVDKTIKGLTEREADNTTSFNNWPKIQRTPYKLEPRRRISGLGVTTRGIVIGIAIGIGIGIGIGISRRGQRALTRIIYSCRGLIH